MASSKEAQEANKTVDRWVADSKTLRIVIFGKTGAGKSSLINTLFKERLAKEGGTLYAETKVVKSYTKSHRITLNQIQFTINGIHVTLWDTPGLNDPFSARDREEIIKEIGDKCDIRNEIDLFVYCTRFDVARLDGSDVECIRDISKAFGDEIWNKALIALTFADQAKVPPSASNKTQLSRQEYIQSREEEWKGILHQVFEEKVNMVDSKIGRSIPIIPTGYGDEPLPEGWFVNFWTACLSRVKVLNIPALMRAANNQVLIEVQPDVTTRVLGQRLAEIGDFIEQERLDEKIRTDGLGRQESPSSPRVVPTPPLQWSDILIESIQRFQKLTF